MYSINNSNLTITRVPIAEALNSTAVPWIKTPALNEQKLTQQELDDLVQLCTSCDTDYSIPGVMLCDQTTGLRSKIRNSEYEKVRRLRGNQPKLQYRFLTLRQQAAEDVKAYLQYYPEDANAFSKYGQQVRSFTHNLHREYMECKVRKEKNIKSVPYEHCNHVYALHGHYLDILRQEGGVVTRRVVEAYVNDLPAARLMYSINYPLATKGRVIESHLA